MARCKKQTGGISDIVNTIISNINKARENDPVRKAQARYQRRIMTRQGEYEGGDFGGAGAGTEITYVPDYTYINRNDTIYVPITRTFNDAFNEARRAGLSEFDFNGKRYTTEMGNNPNSTAAGNARTETDILRFIRYNVDKNKINKDGSVTRVGTSTRYGFKNGGIVSINGNVKNGLIYYSAPSSTGELPDRSVMHCGGRKQAPWGTLEDGSQVWITDDGRTLNPGDDFEVMLSTDFPDIPKPYAGYNFMYPNNDAIDYLNKNNKTNKSDKNKTNKDNNNSRVNLDYTNYYPNITGTGMLTLPRKNSQNVTQPTNTVYFSTNNDLENNRPQYYAERNLPLFEDGAAINSGLVRAGWSHGNGYQPNISIDIPTMTVNTNRSYGTSPRKGGENRTNSAPTSTGLPHVRQNLPAVPRLRNSLAVEANLDPGKVPASVLETAHRQATGFRQYGEYAGVTPRDWLSLAGNVAGSIGSWIASRNAPRVTIAEPNRPFIEMPVRLRTHYNNRPQIANVEQQARRSYRQIGENTGSSAAALARMQRVRNAAVQNINELNAEKENIETQLTNQDRLNRQQVRARNARTMNQYYQDLASAKTRQSIADAQRKSANQSALSNLLNNINVSFQDFLGRMDRRESFNNTLAYLRAANPNYDDRMFKDNGADFARMYLQGLNVKV